MAAVAETVNVPRIVAACGSQTKRYVPAVSVTVQVCVPANATVVVWFTPGPVRWKLWMPRPVAHLDHVPARGQVGHADAVPRERDVRPVVRADRCHQGLRRWRRWRRGGGGVAVEAAVEPDPTVNDSDMPVVECGSHT